MCLKPMANILIKRGRGRFETDRRGEGTHTEDHVKVEQEEMQPQAKECQQPLEVGRSKEWILPHRAGGSGTLPAP